MATKFHPKREDGLCAYVVTKRSWGKAWDRVEWAESLADAKSKFGWTREMHTSISVRRATADEVQTIAEEN
jgi:hypothetical protein